MKVVELEYERLCFINIYSVFIHYQSRASVQRFWSDVTSKICQNKIVKIQNVLTFDKKLSLKRINSP